MIPDEKKSVSGFTLIELIIAITVSSIVITLSLTVFTDLTRGINFQTNHAKNVRKMLLIKKQIDQVLSEMESVETCSKNSIRFYKSNELTVSELLFKNSTVYDDKRMICKGVKDFSVNLIQNEKSKCGTGKKAILWDCELENGLWIGGAWEN